MSPEQLAAMAGTNAYKGGHVGGSFYDTITLGKDGKFYLSYYSQPKDEREDPIAIGASLKLTIVKVRSKLTVWEKSVKVLESVEYDAGATAIATTKGNMTEKEAKDFGASKSLVIYAEYKGSLVKLTVSGGSLYNPDDEEDLRLYSYLQSFEGDDHIFMAETTVKAKEVEYTDRKTGEEKTAYHMTFAKGKKSDLALVGTTLTTLTESLPDNDARDLKFLGYEKKAEEQYEGTTPATNEAEESDEPF
jgi:hypothetical protein